MYISSLLKEYEINLSQISGERNLIHLWSFKMPLYTQLWLVNYNFTKNYAIWAIFLPVVFSALLLIVITEMKPQSYALSSVEAFRFLICVYNTHTEFQMP